MIMLARRAKPFDPRSKGNVSEGREALRGLPWPIVAPIVAQTALQPEVAATSLPCLVTQCLAALHNAQANCTACNTAVTRPRVRRNVTSYTAARKPPPPPPIDSLLSIRRTSLASSFESLHPQRIRYLSGARQSVGQNYCLLIRVYRVFVMKRIHLSG